MKEKPTLGFRARFGYLLTSAVRLSQSSRRRSFPVISNVIVLVITLTTLVLGNLGSSNVDVAYAQTSGDTTLYLPIVENNPVSPNRGVGEWPMSAGNPQRTSWTATEVTGQLKAEWFIHFDAYISQKVQIIAADDKLFISATDGLHALNSDTGQELWFFETSLPPGNSPTYKDGVLYLGVFDHNLYAINADNGSEIWRFTADAGFETNPLVVNGLVMAGNRDGYFYAVYATGAQAGQLAWKFKTDGPILYSAAYQDGTVYFASSDMYAYALNLNGALVWKSNKLPGGGFHSWWPVVYKDYVVFSGGWNYRVPGPYGEVTPSILDKAAYPSNAVNGSAIGAKGTEPGDWAAGTTTMNASRISQYYEDYPWRRTTIVLRRSNGQEYSYDSDGDGRPEYAPYLYQGTTSGNRYPPAIGPDNVLYQANSYIYNEWIQSGQITGWKFGTSTISIPTTETNAIDEPLVYAIGGNTVYWKRCCDRKAGSFNLVSHANVIYYAEGGSYLRRTLPELFDLGWDYSYWKHGDGSPPIPYNGRVYSINNNAVVAFSNHGRGYALPENENVGSNTGTAPSNIERSTVITGLNTKVTLNNSTWPLLYQQERYYEFYEKSSTRAAHFSLFEVAGTGSGSPSSMTITSNSASTKLVSSYGGGTLTTWVSNRAPAVLFQNTGNQYKLNGSFAGIAYPTSGGVQVRMGNASINGAELTESWFMIWDSTAQHRWMPVVISLQNRPSQISFTTTGLVVSYSGAAGNLAVTPIYGMSAPKSDEESIWPGGIPADTVDRVRLLNELARAFPIDVTESLNINASSGDAELSYTYQYLYTTDSTWKTNYLQLAYLPTQVALAAWNGSPIRINGLASEDITDVNFVTPIGRVAGVIDTNVAKVLLPGIANTWRQTMASPSMPAAGDPTQAKLIEQVQKIIAAGHLLPGYGKNGLWDIMARDYLGHHLADYWHNPAETVYTLIRALPLLPANLQTQVRNYLISEFAAYPTYSITYTGWVSGAHRDAFDLQPEVEADRSSIRPCGSCNNWGFSPENHYASWMYATIFGGAQNIYNNTISDNKISASPVFQQSLSYGLNSQIAGYIGYLRLASMAGAGSLPNAEKTLVNLLVLRAALSKYPSALEAVGFEYGGYKWAMRTYAPNMPDTLFVLRTIGTLWSQTPLYGYRMDTLYGLSGPSEGGAYVFGIDYVNLTPELGAFMQTYTLPEEANAIAEYEYRTPYWFVSGAEEAAGEGVVRPIYDTIALFQAKAYILQASRSELEQYIDAPAVPVGDLYYIQKLIMTLEASY